jgi:hypothetical protein
MEQLATGEPEWDLQFDENGNLTSPAQGDFLAQVASQGVQDLFMFSHGWGTAPSDAQALYATMFPLIQAAAQGSVGPGQARVRRDLLAVAVVPAHPGFSARPGRVHAGEHWPVGPAERRDRGGDRG